MNESELLELTRRLQLALARISRQVRRETPSALGQSAISTLAILAAEGPLRPGDLATREGVRPPTMTRIITSLEEGGYVARTADPADGRACLVAITPLGTEEVSGAKTARAGQFAAHLARLNSGQLTALQAAVPVLEALIIDEYPG